MTAVARVEAPFAMLMELEAAGALTSTALHLPEMTRDRYEALGTLLGRIDSASKWWIGDYMVGGEVQFGELAYQAIEALNLSESTRQRYLSVAQKVPPTRRKEELSWTHHRHVAPLEPDDQVTWLERAADESLSAHDLFAALQEARVVEPPRGGGRAAVVTAARGVVATAERIKDYYRVPFDAYLALEEAVMAEGL